MNSSICRSFNSPGDNNSNNPSIPGAGRGPRKKSTSNVRISWRNLAGLIPPAAKGCLPMAKRSIGKKLFTISLAVRRKNEPATVCRNGIPAESSIFIPQRLSSLDTRRERRRSGVIRAAVFLGVSKTSRNINAITPASSSGPGQVIISIPLRACLDIELNNRQSLTFSAGHITSEISFVLQNEANSLFVTIESRALLVGHGFTSPAVKLILVNNRKRPNWGCVSISYTSFVFSD